MTKTEYIWMDGTQPTKRLRSKTKILEKASWLERRSELPRWGFDGSSTGQASGHQSDCLLQPVYHSRLLMETVCDERQASKEG